MGDPTIKKRKYHTSDIRVFILQGTDDGLIQSGICCHKKKIVCLSEDLAFTFITMSVYFCTHQVLLWLCCLEEFKKKLLFHCSFSYNTTQTNTYNRNEYENENKGSYSCPNIIILFFPLIVLPLTES